MKFGTRTNEYDIGSGNTKTCQLFSFSSYATIKCFMTT